MRSDAVDIYWVVRFDAIDISSLVPLNGSQEWGSANCMQRTQTRADACRAVPSGVFMFCIKPAALMTVNLD
jgi:hypothetical protein